MFLKFQMSQFVNLILVRLVSNWKFKSAQKGEMLNWCQSVSNDYIICNEKLSNRNQNLEAFT